MLRRAASWSGKLWGRDAADQGRGSSPSCRTQSKIERLRPPRSKKNLSVNRMKHATLRIARSNVAAEADSTGRLTGAVTGLAKLRMDLRSGTDLHAQQTTAVSFMLRRAVRTEWRSDKDRLAPARGTDPPRRPKAHR